MEETPLIEIRNLKTYYPIRGGFFNSVQDHLKAVDDVSLKIGRKQTYGLVGESGSGKSTLGRSILRLQPITSGQILFEGKDITNVSPTVMMQLRRNIQIIFQDPYGSLNPRMTVRQIIREPLDTHQIGDKSERDKAVYKLLEVCGMERAMADRYPHEFSGGQRQRVGIARALALKPKFIVADEAVSALDVTVQEQILKLIAQLQEEFGISFLFISHDLAVVQHVSHIVGVMHFGKLVEEAPAEELYRNPQHDYTKKLLNAVPKIIT